MHSHNASAVEKSTVKVSELLPHRNAITKNLYENCVFVHFFKEMFAACKFN